MTRSHVVSAAAILSFDQIDDIAHGRAKLQITTSNEKRPKIYRLSEDELNAFAVAKQRGYFFDRDKFAPLVNFWLATAQVPVVHIAQTWKYSTVIMDTITVPQEIREKFLRLTSHQHPPEAIGGKTQSWSVLTYVKYVPKENAQACAEWLLGRYRMATS